jgi:hypothetical protein
MRRLLLIGALAGSGGCLMAGNYHTAKTLEKGESQVGLTFSGTQYSKTVTDSSTGQSHLEGVFLPNILPEITYHIGMADNLEVGGRVSLGALGMEGDFKYRFFRNDKLHLAIAPAIGGQAFIVVKAAYVRIPLIMTYELADNIDFNAAVYGATAHYSPVLDDGGTSDFGEFNGTLLSSGAAIGFDLHGETFSIRPAVEFTRYLYNFSADGSSASDGFNTVNVLVHLAWTGGKEKKQLDRIEQKIDRLSAPPAYGPPPGPPPGGAPPGAPPSEPPPSEPPPPQ